MMEQRGEKTRTRYKGREKRKYKISFHYVVVDDVVVLLILVQPSEGVRERERA